MPAPPNTLPKKQIPSRMTKGLQYILATMMLLTTQVQSGKRITSLPESYIPVSNLSHEEEIKLRVPNYEGLSHFTYLHKRKKITAIDFNDDGKIDVVYVGEKASFFQTNKADQNPLTNKYFKHAQEVRDAFLEANDE